MSGKEGEEKGRRSGGGEGGVMDLLSKRAFFFRIQKLEFGRRTCFLVFPGSVHSISRCF